MGVDSEQRAQLEAIHARHAALQSGGLPVHLRDSAFAEYPAAESARTRSGERASRVQYRGQFHHQHQLAELRRRIHHVVLLADGRAGLSQFRFRRDRHRYRCRVCQGDRAAFGQDDRQLLGRFGPRDLLPAAADLPRLRGLLVSQGMIQNFKPYTKATLVEPMKIQVEKKNDKGETIKGLTTSR